MARGPWGPRGEEKALAEEPEGQRDSPQPQYVCEEGGEGVWGRPSWNKQVNVSFSFR